MTSVYSSSSFSSGSKISFTGTINGGSGSYLQFQLTDSPAFNSPNLFTLELQVDNPRLYDWQFEKSGQATQTGSTGYTFLNGVTAPFYLSLCGNVLTVSANGSVILTKSDTTIGQYNTIAVEQFGVS